MRRPGKIQPFMSFKCDKSEPTFVDFAPRNHLNKSHDQASRAGNVQKPQTHIYADTNREYCLERGEDIFALLEKNCVLRSDRRLGVEILLLRDLAGDELLRPLIGQGDLLSDLLVEVLQLCHLAGGTRSRCENDSGNLCINDACSGRHKKD